MAFVQEAERYQHESGARAELVGQPPLDVELFDFRFTFVVRGRHRVLPFEFAVNARFFVEAMAESDDRPHEIGLRVVRVVRSRVGDFAVAEERRIAFAWWRFCGRLLELVDTRRQIDRRRSRRR